MCHWLRNITLLPRTNEVCKGYVFTGVCLSTGGCLPHCVLGYIPLGQTPPGQTYPWVDTVGQTLPSACWDTHTPLCPVHAGIHLPAQCMLRYTPCTVHAGIQSTSGQYAFHWNAFLSSNEFNYLHLRRKIKYTYFR